MALRFESVAYDAADPTVVARFWGRLLDRHPMTDAAGILLPGNETQVGLRFVPQPEGPGERTDRLHLHLTSVGADDMQRVIEQAISLGAQHLDVGQAPEEGHVVLADPEGNAFCVIEPKNSFLAGTGFLGEVACDGTRNVGVFWSQLLNWPLVWDQDQETAIQAPAGGTKVAWGGPPVGPKTGRNRQHFRLTGTTDPANLEALGALALTGEPALPGQTWFTDPDGNEFVVTDASAR